MKFFSRKSIVAAATAATIAFSGTAVATAAPAEQDGSSAAFFALSSDDEGNVSPKEIREWIKVLTSIIGAMDDAMRLGDKLAGK
ncbi:MULTISPECIES: hypothetical protein [Corynebacterium]|uniref:EF-hand domain-containing protein n=1 Tax=Corynebacterium minutissimum TaxID=38301 RepID=A0A2X4UP37_9CORY|nr:MULTISPECIES: hypothetical protein [Corynebacterium]KHO29261.1 hypothetical protein NX84_08050 [Corynebacterium minutissimum]MCG7228257.1 hypothetical protein [Corynebacterium minutissimum]MCG7238559.1 hypothetical protein [Corynebacterium minutissimum]MDK8763257.1 hypothetical protein [Corynebacterium sp. MSK218]OFR63187.1 hypothetical protein HMPREF2875_02675 [Corynebacterium sp. HMSC078H07]